MSSITEEMRYRQRLCEYAFKHVLTVKTYVTNSAHGSDTPILFARKKQSPKQLRFQNILAQPVPDF